MKLLHFSDTHLGFSEYFKIDPDTGLNQREQDFYTAWQQVITAIFQHKPDVVVHAGDLFHTPRPNNRAIRIALESIQKLSDASIPLVIVAGNHETPRIRTTGSIFESIALFPHVYAAYSSMFERFTVNDIDFYCIPHCSLTEEMDRAFVDLASANSGRGSATVFVSHGAWGGQYGMGEFNEQRLPDVEIKSGMTFNYIALGHYHRYVEVKENACYSSSTERTSLNEHNTNCGYVIVDLESGARTYHTIHPRPMKKFPPLDCQDLTTSVIYEKLTALATSDIQDAIIQVTLANVENDAFLRLNMREIDEIFKDTFYLEKQIFRKLSESKQMVAQSKIEALPVEFERFLVSHTGRELDKKKLAEMGAHYLEAE
ncbi:exonuclease SbcCD subunit D [candidate division KSB1 bacterium]|nr:exonuclease SbcCD subunit D [candidate division KSB1 bacterium]